MDMYSLNNIYMKKVFGLLFVVLVLLCSCKKKEEPAVDAKPVVLMQRSPQQTTTLTLYLFSARLTLSFFRARDIPLARWQLI